MENGINITDQHEKVIRYVEVFVEKTRNGHEEARQRRDYVDHIQHTAEEEATLRARKQPIITDNRIYRKMDYFRGIERQSRTDPKAFPRTPEHEKAAHVFTDGIRYVCDNNDFDVERSEAFDYLMVEGIEAYIVGAKNVNDEMEIEIDHIPWDRIIYDPHSRNRYFEDAKYKGTITWMDEADVKLMFKGKDDAIAGAYLEEHDGSVHDDRPNDVVWCDKDRKRVKVIQLYSLEGGVWMHCIFTKGGFLIDPEPSKYKNEYGQPTCPIEMGGAYCDKDNDRFGPVRYWISLQDLVNKSISKYMHFLNTRQTWGNKQGPDANKVKSELAKPDGHVEDKGSGKFGENFGILNTNDQAAGAFSVLQNAINSLEQIGGNDVLASSASGRSKEVEQQNKLLELGPVLDTHRQVSKRVYRQVWCRIKQFWNTPKWVRVTDDENKLQFLQLNQPYTYEDYLVENYGENWAEQFPQAVNHPQLKEVKEIRNNTVEIDVDIIIEEAPDIVNIQIEQFELLVKLAERYGPQEVPFEDILKLSSLRNKDEMLEKRQGANQAQQEAMAQEQEKNKELMEQITMLEAELKAANVDKVEAEIENINAKTDLDRAKAANLNQDTEGKDIDNEFKTQQAISLGV